VKLEHLVDKNIIESNFFNSSSMFKMDVIIQFLKDTGLSELRINMMRTHTGEPFISFSMSDNEAVKKLSKFINP